MTKLAILRGSAHVLLAGFFGAMIWTLAVLAASRYLSIGVSEHTFARILKDFAAPVGVLIAGVTFAWNVIHQRLTVRRDREKHLLEMALPWVDKAVEVIEGAAVAADKGQPFYTRTTDLQLRSAAQLLEAAGRRAATLQESQFRDHYAADASYASSRVLEIFRFRGTCQFFDIRYYNAVQMGLRNKADLSKKSLTSYNLAFYHNDSIEAFEAFEGEVNELPIDEGQKENFRRFGFFLDLLKKGTKPFGHPLIGAAIQPTAAEAILRFALRKPASTELADVFQEDAAVFQEFTDLFQEDKAILRSEMMGLHIVLYQLRYFDLDPSGKVILNRSQSQDA